MLPACLCSNVENSTAFHLITESCAARRGVARGVTRDVARGFACGVARCVARGVALGVARCVARSVARGVAPIASQIHTSRQQPRQTTHHSSAFMSHATSCAVCLRARPVMAWLYACISNLEQCVPLACAAKRLPPTGIDLHTKHICHTTGGARASGLKPKCNCAALIQLIGRTANSSCETLRA